MIRRVFRKSAVAVLIVTMPAIALADVSGTVILQANSALNLETGAVGNSGDILWNGTTIAPQGQAKVRNIGQIGSFTFGNMTQSLATTYTTGANATPIAANLLVPGDMFAALTNTGKVVRTLVTRNNGGSIILHFVTYGVDGAGVPVIDSVYNNASFVPPDATNYGIAPSSLFVVAGTGLSDPGAPVLQSSAAPGLPLTLKGASIAVVVNGTTTHPALYYASPTAIAAVLPANTPVGSGTITVTYQGRTSAPSPIEVVPAALGINFYNTNTGVATDAFTGAILTFTNSGMPGETIVLWTTGLGANPADSDTTYSTTPHAVNTPLQIYIGGVPASILYQGGSGYPGVNQINLTIPDSVPTGCWIPMVAVAGSLVSNVVTLPINKNGGECLDVLTGVSGKQMTAGSGVTLRTGLLALIQTDAPNKDGSHTVTSSTDAAFEKYTGLYQPPSSLSPGGCTVIYKETPVPLPSFTGLDVGTVTLTGPGGVDVTLGSQGIKGAFYKILTAGAIPQSGGSFTFKVSGGADVGGFTSTLNLSPLFKWTNQNSATTIDRSQDFAITWSGGNPGSYVYINGSSTSLGLGWGAFTCLATADSGHFTIPSYILSALPPGTGGISLQNAVYQPFSTSGIDAGVTDASIGFSSGSITIK